MNVQPAGTFDPEHVVKHLEMIQAISSRMASNSFFLKGWSVTLAAAIIALAASGTDRRFILVALIPAIAFWCLDAYYLRKERLFRKLYDDVRSLLVNQAGIAIPTEGLFSMKTSKYEVEVDPLWKIMKTLSVFMVHGVLVMVIGAIAVWFWLFNP